MRRIIDERPRPGRNLLQRVLIALAGAVVVISAFFFLTVALIAGAILAGVIAVRFWWVMRRMRAQARAQAPLEGEFTVVERNAVTYRTQREREAAER